MSGGACSPSPLQSGDAPKLKSPLPSARPTSQFHVVIGSRAEEGQYNLNFHNCDNSVPGREQPFDITVSGGGGQWVHGALTVGQDPMCIRETGNLRIRNERMEPGDSHSGPSTSRASLQPPVPLCSLRR